MRVLVTSVGTPLCRALAESLAGEHQVRATDFQELDLPPNLEFVRSDLGHDRGTDLLVQGMDAIVHYGGTDPALSASERLDRATRCTYNLLWAAAHQGVPRVIFLSSLSIMGRYDEAYVVTERWRPVPTTDVGVLGYHLGEFVCREFAREKRLTVFCLRLGDLVQEGQPPPSTSALYLSDAIQAVQRALTADPQTLFARWHDLPAYWNVFHIQSDVPDARYITTEAQRALGYSPSR